MSRPRITTLLLQRGPLGGARQVGANSPEWAQWRGPIEAFPLAMGQGSVALKNLSMEVIGAEDGPLIPTSTAAAQLRALAGGLDARVELRSPGPAQSRGGETLPATSRYALMCSSTGPQSAGRQIARGGLFDPLGRPEPWLCPPEWAQQLHSFEELLGSGITAYKISERLVILSLYLSLNRKLRSSKVQKLLSKGEAPDNEWRAALDLLGSSLNSQGTGLWHAEWGTPQLDHWSSIHQQLSKQGLRTPRKLHVMRLPGPDRSRERTVGRSERPRLAIWTDGLILTTAEYGRLVISVDEAGLSRARGGAELLRAISSTSESQALLHQWQSEREAQWTEAGAEREDAPAETNWLDWP